MPRQKAVEYIRKYRSEGFSDDEMRKELESAGWPREEINLAFVESRAERSSTHTREAKMRLEGPVPGEQTFGQENFVVENILKKKEAIAVRVDMRREPFATPGLKKIFLVGTVLLVLAAGIAGGFWYYTTNISPSRLQNTAFNALGSTKQFHYETRLTMRLKNDAGQARDVIASFAPGFAGLVVEGLESYKSAPGELQNVSVNTTVDVDVADAEHQKRNNTVVLGLGEYSGSDFTYISRQVGDTQYFKLSQLPEHLPTTFGFDFATVSTSSIADTWMRASAKTFAEDYASASGHMRAIDGALDTLLGNFVHVPDQIAVSSGDSLAALAKKLARISWDQETFNEEVDGERTVRFKGIADGNFLLAVQMLAQGDASPERLKKLQVLADNLGSIEVNVWVSRGTGQVVRMMAQAAASVPSDLSELAFSLTIKTSADASNFEEPADAHDFMPVVKKLQNIMVLGFEISSMQARDNARAIDLEKIQSALALYFKTRARYPQALSALVPEFIAVLPKDALTQKNYTYKLIGAKDYILSAQFEYDAHSLLKNDVNPKNTLYEVRP